MSRWFNKFLAKTVPLAPKFFVGWIAKKYIAGETLDEAIAAVKQSNKSGFTATMDVLGEDIENLSESEMPTQIYLDLLEIINIEKVNSNISLKLSQLGFELDTDAAWINFERVLKKVKDSRNFLRIDMEDSSLTDLTLNIFKRAKSLYPKVGAVLQAYLFRSINDLKEILPLEVNIRICKGIYRESPDIAYQSPEDIRKNFLNLVKMLLEYDGYAAIATHDLSLISACEDYIKENNIRSNRYEFQALFGVPIQKTLTRLVNEGHTVRLYVPFGEDWYPYCMRRLKENPNIAGYIFKDFFKFKSS